MQKPLRRILTVLFVCLLVSGLFTVCAYGSKLYGHSSSNANVANTQQTLSVASSKQQTVLFRQSSEMTDIEKAMSDLNGTLNGLTMFLPATFPYQILEHKEQ